MAYEILMKEAWALFEKALNFDEKAKDKTKTEQLQKMARRAAGKYLDQAVEKERLAHG